jgi:hypothetical protein
MAAVLRAFTPAPRSSGADTDRASVARQASRCGARAGAPKCRARAHAGAGAVQAPGSAWACAARGRAHRLHCRRRRRRRRRAPRSAARSPARAPAAARAAARRHTRAGARAAAPRRAWCGAGMHAGAPSPARDAALRCSRARRGGSVPRRQSARRSGRLLRRATCRALRTPRAYGVCGRRAWPDVIICILTVSIGAVAVLLSAPAPQTTLTRAAVARSLTHSGRPEESKQVGEEQSLRAVKGGPLLPATPPA